MQSKRLGGQTVILRNNPKIISRSTIVGQKESQGPLAKYFDIIMPDNLWGEKSWEKTECRMLKEVAETAITKANKQVEDINYMFAGDLLNQIMTSNFAARILGIPFFGLFGACSTMTQSLSLGAMVVDGGYANNVLCATSSHFCTAERQFRYPLEQGTLRAPTGQWTVTGAGAVILSNEGQGPSITHVTTGKVIDYGMKDVNNMGAAMAPAAAETIKAHFEDTGRDPNYYDLIVTGDLARHGRELAIDLLMGEGYDIADKYIDCGDEIYSEDQNVQSGGSGCGCAAVVLAG
ncbi:MAG: stage V sporulation protein AD, partial [Clostridiales bacterium]|nr:stage V sporulation protein AD [Clostridiales bacterium]